jgi:ethanolamine permease
LVFVSSVGVAGWEAIVYKPDGSTSDSPLPMALAQIVAGNNFLYHLLITVGLLGLVASFHGILLAAGRASFEFGRVGSAPAFVGTIHPRFKTPANALIVNMVLGIIALLTGKTAEIITISVFGALSLYILSMVALLRLRVKEPGLERPFKVPLYPLAPITALVIAVVSFISMTIYNFKLALLFFLILALCYLLYKLFWKTRPVF